MRSINIFRSHALTACAITAIAAAGLTSCNDDEVTAGTEPAFQIINAENRTILIDAEGSSTSSDKTGMDSYDSGIVYEIEASGTWTLTPTEPDLEWIRVYPLSGHNEGAIRVYATNNELTAKRTATYTLAINGVKQPQPLTITQKQAPASFKLSANNVSLKPAGGTYSLSVISNVDWIVDYDTSLDWLTIEKTDNSVIITAPRPNDTGAHLNTTIYIRGVEPYDNEVFAVKVTQLSVLFFEDFSWLPCTQSPPVYWVDPSTKWRLDQWPSKFKDVDPAVLTSWTGVKGTLGKVISWSLYNYILLGSSQVAGNICSPTIPSVRGAIDAKVTWNMAGFCSKKNIRAEGNMYYVALLGPGKITEAKSNGKSTGKVVTGQFTIPYNSAGEGTTSDIDLTEIAGFTIGADGYFDMTETTGLLVWEQPETEFGIVIEGITAETRIVFIGTQADKVTMLNGWDNSNGDYIDTRKCFDNFKVEQN